MIDNAIPTALIGETAGLGINGVAVAGMAPAAAAIGLGSGEEGTTLSSFLADSWSRVLTTAS